MRNTERVEAMRRTPLRHVAYALQRLSASARAGSFLGRFRRRARFAARAIDQDGILLLMPKEPSLAFYQGGAIREESDNAYLEHTDPLVWPRWIVMSREIWEASPQDVRARLEIIDFARGWWYANRGKRVEVLVARKRRA